MLKKRLFVVVSKTAAAKDQLAGDLEARGFNFKLAEAADPPSAFRLVSRLDADEFDAVAVLGGDGTVVAVLKGSQDLRLPVLILPGGTANIIATDLRLPGNIGACLDLIAGGTYVIRHLDVAEVNGRPMILDIHFGLMAEAIKSTPRRLKRRLGTLAYGWSAVRQLPGLEPYEYDLEIDGKKERLRAYFLLIANQGYQNVLGLPIFTRPHGRGVLQLAALRTLNQTQLLKWLLWRWLTGHNLQSVVKTSRANRITINSAPESLICDDDSLNLPKPIHVEAGPHVALAIAPAPVGGEWWSRTWLIAQAALVRAGDHIRRTLTGAPGLEYSHVAPGLYLGGQYRGSAWPLFRRWGITGVISMRRSVQQAAPEGVERLHLPTTDWEPPTLEALRQGVAFITRHIQSGGAVYVHCRLGEGRGPSMAAAYLISRGMRVEDAVHHLQRFRPFVRPNPKQLRQLARWQEEVG